MPMLCACAFFFILKVFQVSAFLYFLVSKDDIQFQDHFGRNKKHGLFADVQCSNRC